MSRHPEVKWAQRTDKLYLTVELPDAKNPKVKIEPEGKFEFSATTGPENVLYELELHLFDKVNVEESKISVGLRHVFCVLIKKENRWWKRLLHAEGKAPPYLKADWDKWVDEDEENEAPSDKLDNFDLGSMNDFSDFNMGGGMDDEDESDSDDEDGATEFDKSAKDDVDEKDESPSSTKDAEAAGTSGKAQELV